MNKTQMLKMARKAGLLVPSYREHTDQMMDFSRLVAEAERKRLIEGVKTPYPDVSSVFTFDRLVEFGAQCAIKARNQALDEAAELCESRAESVANRCGYPEGLKAGAKGCAEAIKSMKDSK